ncbi:MFS transporter [Pseudonocardia alaniniphila]|uniref:MHS family MFS transporter n=1 Tax=Pseudonocardia alaniniphila TaxID=75291 RepID=A0ABS9TBM5_9PSEU|nr:MFS transporter [Pseudonocardia alaniniphila]MCH6165788.1 MHS family MFS transporter [Pseudonocardia alaniniphila]
MSDAVEGAGRAGAPGRRRPLGSGESARPSPQARRAAAASLIGTAIEYYDFFLYGLAASVVFGPQYFPSFSPVAGTLAALGTFLAGFLVRPIGALVFGHFGDRIGRKRLLVISLLTAGGATFVIGLLPTYATIGVAAPILLVACRVVQGFGFGGEWGGAVLMAVENAPSRRRIVYGSLPQMGNPAGLILATAILLAFTTLLPADQFQAWGWRIPFLLSAALIVTGLIIRVRLRESPAFTHARETRALARFPLGELLRAHPRELVLGTLVVTASPSVGLLLYVYLIPYGQQVLHLPVTTMLILAGISGIGLILGIRMSAVAAEHLGVRRLSVCGLLAMAAWAIPFFLLFDTGSLPAAVIAFALFGLAVGVANGPQATLLAELYPIQVRYSGASLALQLAGVLGGVIAPVASTALLAATGNGLYIGIWVIAISLISLVSLVYLHTGAGVDASESEQGAALTGAA